LSEDVRDVDSKRLFDELVRSVRTLNRSASIWIDMSSSSNNDPLKILCDFLISKSTNQEIRLILKGVLEMKTTRTEKIVFFYMNLVRDIRREILIGTSILDDVCRVFFPFLFKSNVQVEDEKKQYVPILLQRFASLLLDHDNESMTRKRCHDMLESCADRISSSSSSQQEFVRDTVMISICDSKVLNRLYIDWTIGRLIRTDHSNSVRVTLELMRHHGNIISLICVLPILSGLFLRGYRQNREWFANVERCGVRETIYVLSKEMFQSNITDDDDDDSTKRYVSVVIFQGFTDLSILIRMYLGEDVSLPNDLRKPHIELCQMKSLDPERKYRDMFPCSDPNQLLLSSRIDELRVSHMNLYRSITSCFRVISNIKSLSAIDLSTLARSREFMRKLSLSRRLMVG